MYRYLSVFVLSAALMGPAALIAQDRDRQGQDRGQQDRNQQGNRYYDKNGKDWHDWNDNETTAYRRYLQENHKKDHNFAKAGSRERAEYFKWRHAHPDSSDNRR
jgi:hypothetical protein